MGKEFFFIENRPTVDGSEIPFPTTVWMYKPNPCKYDGILNYQPHQLRLIVVFPHFFKPRVWFIHPSLVVGIFGCLKHQVAPRPSLRLDSGYRGASPDHGFAVRTVEDHETEREILGEQGSRAYGKSKPGTNSDTVGNHLDQNTVKMLRTCLE